MRLPVLVSVLSLRIALSHGIAESPSLSLAPVAERIQVETGAPASAQAEASFGPHMTPLLNKAVLSGLDLAGRKPAIKSDFPNLVHTVVVQRIAISLNETDHVALSKEGLLTVRTVGTPEALQALPKLIAETLERVAALHAKQQHS